MNIKDVRLQLSQTKSTIRELRKEIQKRKLEITELQKKLDQEQVSKQKLREEGFHISRIETEERLKEVLDQWYQVKRDKFIQIVKVGIDPNKPDYDLYKINRITLNNSRDKKIQTTSKGPMPAHFEPIPSRLDFISSYVERTPQEVIQWLQLITGQSVSSNLFSNFK